MPEAGLSLPIGDFKTPYVFASQGFEAGLNIDMFWGKFGLGLYGGINNNKVKYEDELPLSTNGLIIGKSSTGSKFEWSQFLVGLGPILNLDFSEKFDLELSSKFGFSKFSYPDYTEFVEVSDPLNQEYLMYETRNEDVEEKLNAMLRSSARLSFKPSKSIVISLGAHYNYAGSVLHSYRYLDGGFTQEMSNDELETALRASPTVNEIWKCDFNTVGITLGIGIVIGGGKDQPEEVEKMEPPIPSYPEDGSTITPQEADSLTLEWVKETPNVEKANYNLWLYEVRDSTRKHDSLIYQTKVERSLKLLLPDNIKLRPDSTYRYIVQAIDDPKLKPCPDNCNSVDAVFTISNILQVQHYHLLTQNVGTYIEMKDQVKFVLPNNIETGGIVRAAIINEANEEVLKIEDLNADQESKIFEMDENGRIILDIRSLEGGYYVLEVSNERNKKYYLRIFNTKINETTKD